MEVKSVIFTGSSGETIGSVIALAPLDSWRQAYFNPAEREDPALISDSVDPDGDGLSNLAEYVAGLNPRSPDAPSPSGRAGLPRNDSDGTASPPILRLLWTGPSPGLPGVTTGAEEGPDLQTWTPVPIIVDSTIAGTISLRAESTPITDAHRFLRLSIQRSAVSP